MFTDDDMDFISVVTATAAASELATGIRKRNLLGKPRPPLKYPNAVSTVWYEEICLKMRGNEFQENFRLHYITYIKLLELLSKTWPNLGRHNCPHSFTMEKAVLAAEWV